MQHHSMKQDLALWREYARTIHSRLMGKKNDLYVRLQNIVEVPSHRRLAKLTASFQRILEIGVGGGEHTHFERLETKQYFGIDISYAHLQIAKRQGLDVVQADGNALPFQDSCFDCCVCTGVLEHIVNLPAALAEVNRVLRHNGTFLAVIPTNGSILIEVFKRFMTYPSLRRYGIQHPDWIWHYENVNNFKRIECLLQLSFPVVDGFSLPLRYLPWNFSPLWCFHCTSA